MRISTNNFQHDCLETIHNLLKSNTGQWAKVRKRPSSAANFSPPRPSNAGVAFAELRQTKKIKNQIPHQMSTKKSQFNIQYYQSTKNSILPSLGVSGSGVSISTFTHAKISELAKRKRADPLALLTMSISNSKGL